MASPTLGSIARLWKGRIAAVASVVGSGAVSAPAEDHVRVLQRARTTRAIVSTMPAPVSPTSASPVLLFFSPGLTGSGKNPVRNRDNGTHGHTPVCGLFPAFSIVCRVSMLGWHMGFSQRALSTSPARHQPHLCTIDFRVTR